MTEQDKFLYEIKNVFVPSIEVMMNKEEAHLARLKKYSGSLNVADFMERSELMLDHYKTRLKEYKEYLNKKT